MVNCMFDHASQKVEEQDIFNKKAHCCSLTQDQSSGPTQSSCILRLKSFNSSNNGSFASRRAAFMLNKPASGILDCKSRSFDKKTQDNQSDCYKTIPIA